MNVPIVTEEDVVRAANHVNDTIQSFILDRSPEVENLQAMAIENNCQFSPRILQILEELEWILEDPDCDLPTTFVIWIAYLHGVRSQLEAVARCG